MQLQVCLCCASEGLGFSEPCHHLKIETGSVSNHEIEQYFWRLTISVIHHDAELACLRLVDLFEANDVWVIENLENFGLSESRLFVSIAHLLDVNLFDDSVRLQSKRSSSLASLKCKYYSRCVT